MDRFFIKLLLMTSVLMGFVLHAQETDVIPNIVSPNAASLKKFTDIPVSHYTGTHSLSIPLGEAVSGPLSLPLSLDYHGGAIKPDEPHGWVGMGWALNAGGIISRTVFGSPDGDALSSNGSDFSGIQSAIDAKIPNVIQGFSQFLKIIPLEPLSQNLKSFEEKHQAFPVDHSSDEYSFNFAGYSGKFYQSDNEWRASSDASLEIKVLDYYQIDLTKKHTPAIHPFVPMLPFSLGEGDACRSDPSIDHYFYNPHLNGFKLSIISRFEIKTSDGTRYIFGMLDGESNLKGIELASNFQSDDDIKDLHVSSWYLRKIISANGVHEITLNYQQYEPSLQIYNSFDFLDKDDNQYTEDQFLVAHSVTEVYPWYLTEIIADNGTFQFASEATTGSAASSQLELDYNINFDLYDACAKRTAAYSQQNQYSKRRLNTITLPDNDNVSFSYENASDERLRLGSVSVGNEVYDFEYYTDNLPGYGSANIDLWGYYSPASNPILEDFKQFIGDDGQYSGPTSDGKNLFQGNASSAHFRYNTVDEYFTNLPADVFNSSGYAHPGGALSKITYPTGGYTSFTYELNEATKIVEQDFETGLYNVVDIVSGTGNEYYKYGGHRISQIDYYSSDNPTAPIRSLEYSYEQGICRGKHRFKKSTQLNGDLFFDVSQNAGTISENLGISSLSGVFPIARNNASAPITYSKVTVKEKNINSLGNGETVYYYTNFEDPIELGGYVRTDLPNEDFDYESLGSNASGALDSLKVESWTGRSNELGKSLGKDVKDLSGNLKLKERVEYAEDNTYHHVYLFKLDFRSTSRLVEGGGNGGGLPYSKHFTMYDLSFINTEQQPVSPFLPVKKTVEQFFMDGAVERSTKTEYTYAYNSNGNVTSEYVKTINSNETFIEETSYAYGDNSALEVGDYFRDYISSFEPTKLGVGVFEATMNNLVKEKRSYIKYDDDPNKIYLLGSAKYEYDKIGDVDGNTRVISIKNLELDQPIPSSQDYSLLYPQEGQRKFAYNLSGNVVKYQFRDGLPTMYLWGYGQNKPVAKIIGLDALPSVPGMPTIDEDFTTADIEGLKPFINTSPLVTDNQVYIYEYDLFKGMTAEIDPNGKKTEYGYDDSERVEEIKYEGEIMQEMEYHYKNNTGQ